MKLKEVFEKTVFLLGAGASMHADCLSSKGMLSDLKSSITKLPSTDERRTHFLSIYDFIIQSLVYQSALKDTSQVISDIVNIEDFVAVLKQMIDREYIVPGPLIGSWNSKITSWELRKETILRDFLDYIHDKLIFEWTKFNEDKASELIAPLKSLTTSPESFNMRIFSLNYDLILEKGLNTAGEDRVYFGFSQKQWQGDFDDENDVTKIKLYKLHGSLDWFFDSDQEDIKLGDPENGRPLIVFGSGPKIQSYDPFLSLLSSYRNCLKEASLFITIGYSFQDRYINNILIQSLNSGLNKKLLVVDPYTKGTELDFIKRVELFQSSKSLNEVINLTKISEQKLEFAKISAKEFFESYLANDCSLLREKIIEIEKGEEAFT